MKIYLKKNIKFYKQLEKVVMEKYINQKQIQMNLEL